MSVPPTGARAGSTAVDPRPVVTRRERKKSRTRSDLIEAAATLFSRRGFDETTTVDIAEAADVSQRTLFRHFATKEAVLYGDLDDTLGALRVALRTQPADADAFAVVRGAIADLAPEFERTRERQLLQARLAATYPSVSAYSRATVQLGWEREIINELARRLEVDPMVDPRPEILAGATVSAIRVATRQWSAGGGRDDFHRLVLQALDGIRALDRLGGSPD